MKLLACYPSILSVDCSWIFLVGSVSSKVRFLNKTQNLI